MRYVRFSEGCSASKHMNAKRSLLRVCLDVGLKKHGPILHYSAWQGFLQIVTIPGWMGMIGTPSTVSIRSSPCGQRFVTERITLFCVAGLTLMIGRTTCLMK